MGTFQRSGTFKDRGLFVATFRKKLTALKEGALKGMAETWEEGPPTTASLSGFGVKIRFTIGSADWTCEAEIPAFLPIPQRTIEDKFDREFQDLKGI